MSSSHALLFAFLIGIFCGLRALTPPAVVSWGARAGWLTLTGRLAWIASLPAAIVLTLLALGELVNDKLPKTPPRTAPPSFIFRLLTGGLSGACIACGGGQRVAAGSIAGIVGAALGTLGGYKIRTGIVSALHFPDIIVAIAEDLVAIVGAVVSAMRF